MSKLCWDLFQCLKIVTVQYNNYKPNLNDMTLSDEEDAIQGRMNGADMGDIDASEGEALINTQYLLVNADQKGLSSALCW